MSTSELEEGAKRAVAELLGALQAGDAARYHALLCAEDHHVLDEDAVRNSMAAMQEQSGRLLSYSVEGVRLHEAAGLAAVHVVLEFEITGPKTELYNAVLEDGQWR